MTDILPHFEKLERLADAIHHEAVAEIERQLVEVIDERADVLGLRVFLHPLTMAQKADEFARLGTLPQVTAKTWASTRERPLQARQLA